MTKRVSILVMAVMLIYAIPALAAPDVPDVVAVVNGERISKNDLLATLMDWNGPSVLDEMINFRIIGQEARKAGVHVTVEEVHARMAEIEESMPPGQNLTEIMKRQGRTLGNAFSLVKADLQTEGVLRKSIDVGSDELAQYRRASHILIRTQPAMPGEESENGEDEAREKIEQIAQELEDGLAFDEAATMYSEDPGSKERGGDLSFFTRGQMVPEFEKAVFEMEVGQVSEPIKTMHGYHIIKLTAIGSEAEGEDLEELKEQLLQTRMMQERRDWFLRVRNAAQIENVLEPELSTQPTPQPAVRSRPSGPPPPPAPEDFPPLPPDAIDVEM